MTLQITVGDRPVSMTRAEARQFRDDLALKINTTTDLIPKRVKPPKVDWRTGLATRDSIYSFFGQFYESQAEARKRGGKVYKTLATEYRSNPIAIYCTLCQRPFVGTVSCKSRKNHYNLLYSGIDVVDAINNRKYVFAHIGVREQQLRFDMGLFFKHLIQ